MTFPTYNARNDHSILGRWWDEVDRSQIWTVLLILLSGWIVMFTGSAQEALQGDQPLLNFSAKKFIFVIAGILLMFSVSLLGPQQLREGAPLGFLLALIFLSLIFVMGDTRNGATRWVDLPFLPFAPQPTEFAKPLLVLMLAYCLSQERSWGFLRAMVAAAAAFGLIAALVVLQPDISQAAFLAVIFMVMIFLAGLSLQWVVAVCGAGMAAGFAAYTTLSHVKYRVDGFLARWAGTDGNLHDQTDMAEDAFRQGGIAGRGLGEGWLKTAIPEAKNDMPLAVIGEELGLFGTFGVIVLFFMIWARAQHRIQHISDDFQRLAATGLAFLLLGQALINILYTIGFLPTTGITLPFFSDGGSSLLASALTVGLLLALTRRRGSLRPLT